MGLTVNETLTLINGIELDSYYACLSSRIEMVKNVIRSLEAIPGREASPGGENTQVVVRRSYDYRCAFTQYVSKQARDDGKGAIGSEIISITSDDALTGDIYQVFYDKFKENHPDHADDI